MAHFEIKNLSFSYPASKNGLALKEINLSIDRGEYIAVCGKSGSGKTTLLKHLKSVLSPHGNMEGEIYFEGKPLKESDLRQQSSKIGYVMQNPDNQIVTDKVWHELAFGLESLGIDQKTIRLRVAEMASYFGIQGWFYNGHAAYGAHPGRTYEPAGSHSRRRFSQYSPKDKSRAGYDGDNNRTQTGGHLSCR